MSIELMVRSLTVACALLIAGPWSFPATAGWLDDLAVGETHRLKPGVFHHRLRKAPPASGQSVGVLPVGLDRELADSF